MSGQERNQLRDLPAVDRVLKCGELRKWEGSDFATDAVRETLRTWREELKHGGNKVPSAENIARQAATLLEKRFSARLRRVLNATGIIIHTNLGRSPLGNRALEAMLRVAGGYSTLEFDLEKGRRGSRNLIVHHLLTALTGAEDALVANNNAAALLLALTALARRKEVIVSRGQLVEIGGSFRIPDICRAGGAKLREVGTTNRTNLEDYEQAVSGKTALLMRVHSSNYRIVGFTREVALEELVRLGERHGLPLVDDLGSGALVDPAQWTTLKGEPIVGESVRAGASVVTFSGDKLLGGPQAGLAVGKAEIIGKMRKHPLMRAVRPDKLALAALDAVLRSYLVPENLAAEIPLWRMLTAGLEELERRAETMCGAVSELASETGLKVSAGPSEAHAGGGSLPEEVLESRALVFDGSGRRLQAFQKYLRFADPPIIAYLKDGVLRLDMRTLLLEELEEVITVTRSALEAMAQRSGG